MRALTIVPVLIVGLLAAAPMEARADEKDAWKEARKRYEEREKDRREATREWYKERKEAEKDWEERQREAAKKQREYWRDSDQFRGDRHDHSARRPYYRRGHDLDRHEGRYGYQRQYDYGYGPYADPRATPYPHSYEGYDRDYAREYSAPLPRDYRDHYDNYPQDHGYGHAPYAPRFDRRESYYRGPSGHYVEPPYVEEESWYPGRGSRVGSRIGSLIGGAIGGPEGAAIGGDVGADIGAEVDRH